MTEQPKDHNNTQFLRDIEERKRLTPKSEPRETKSLLVEDFSAPVSFGRNDSSKNNDDSNYRQMLRDLEERRKLSGAQPLSKKLDSESQSKTDESQALKLNGNDHYKNNDGANGENFTHLPHDLAERRKLNPVLPNEAPVSDEALLKNRFETMPARAVTSEKEMKRKTTQSTESGEEKKDVTSGNYTQAYKQKKDDAAKAAREKAQKQNQDEQKRQNDLRKENEIRHKAKELMNQIHWWNEQYGQNRYDDLTIANNLVKLQQELDGIPTVYRN